MPNAAKTLSQVKRERGITKSHDYRPSAHKRGYTSKWGRYSKARLRKHPLCVECTVRGRTEAATVTDHIKPHKGDMKLFWDKANHQSLCSTCHNSKTAKRDGGFGNEQG